LIEKTSRRNRRLSSSPPPAWFLLGIFKLAAVGEIMILLAALVISSSLP
jgi:hypothetical protein